MFLTNLFGKRRKRRGCPPAALRRKARNAGVRTMVKRNGKQVYKSAATILKQIASKK